MSSSHVSLACSSSDDIVPLIVKTKTKIAGLLKYIYLFKHISSFLSVFLFSAEGSRKLGTVYFNFTFLFVADAVMCLICAL